MRTPTRLVHESVPHPHPKGKAARLLHLGEVRESGDAYAEADVESAKPMRPPPALDRRTRTLLRHRGREANRALAPMKRTPIQRKTALKPGKATMPRARLKKSPIKRKKPKDYAESVAFSKAALKGDPLCDRCKETRATEAHHLCSRARGRGHNALHHPLNGAPLCSACHRWAHTNLPNNYIKNRSYLDTL